MTQEKKHIVVNEEIHQSLKKKALEEKSTMLQEAHEILEKELKARGYLDEQ